MARPRDIVIGVVIAFSVLVVLGIFVMGFFSSMTSVDEFGVSGLSGGNVGVLEVDGEINDVMARRLVKQLDKWAETGAIKAVVVQVNSPGGGVAASQEIYDAVLRAKKEKPVVVSMASVAASGGLYVSCAADKIVANPGTLTGSIGVIFKFHTFKTLMDKVGIGTETVKSGELKDVGSYSRPMTEKEQKMLQSVVDDTYEQFVAAVAEGRDLSEEEVRKFADGSVFTGRQALDLGLVDSLGGLHEAVQLAADLGNVKGDINIVRPYRRETVSIFDLLGKFMGKFDAAVGSNFDGPQLMYLFE
ncbi:signal peptide peptidase SppA [candidate division GN15 bacterium]|uniref:Signal peptide peptidase SppA n=1 Tax=candidate division GN15 bacterium TaxID=2072418 RepID=A0A855X2B5_9BACT|nr:MAG: signal peptide peptidase SppA [candidate division GN15 bacterium]